MNRNKLDELSIYMGIDTLQVKSHTTLVFDIADYPFIRSEIVKLINSVCFGCEYRFCPDSNRVKGGCATITPTRINFLIFGINTIA